MPGVKGLKVRELNSRNHRKRTGDTRSWWAECSEVDDTKLRVKLQIEQIRSAGGLTFEERLELKRKVSVIKKGWLKAEARLLKNY